MTKEKPGCTSHHSPFLRRFHRKFILWQPLWRQPLWQLWQPLRQLRQSLREFLWKSREFLWKSLWSGTREPKKSGFTRLEKGAMDWSGQIIATSHDRFPPNGGLLREFPLFQGNLGW